MREYVKRVELPVSCEEAFAWHMRPGAFARLAPGWSGVELESFPQRLTEGSTAVIILPAPLPQALRPRWKALHTRVEPPHIFTDFQKQGPFAFWRHDHVFTKQSDNECYLEDRIAFALPLGLERIGPIGDLVMMNLDKLFEHRHKVTKEDLEEIRKTKGKRAEPMKVLLTGSSGLVGSALASFLTTQGHTVTRLVRDKQSVTENSVYWKPRDGVLDPAVFEGIDAVVHLAGESIASGRWSDSKKQAIRDSRVDSTQLIADALARAAKPPSVFVVASAIGFYGDRGSEPLTEDSPVGLGFLAGVCREWEEATKPAAEAGVRVANMRFGVILSPAGGALQKMLPAFQLGGGGTLGSGEQYMSWISLDDVVGAIHHALVTDSVSGPVNVVAPEPVTNTEFTKTLGKVLGRLTILPVPSFALKMLLGEMAEELLLSSARVVPQKLEKTGYEFRHPELEGALRSLLGK